MQLAFAATAKGQETVEASPVLATDTTLYQPALNRLGQVPPSCQSTPSPSVEVPIAL